MESLLTLLGLAVLAVPVLLIVLLVKVSQLSVRVTKLEQQRGAEAEVPKPRPSYSSSARQAAGQAQPTVQATPATPATPLASEPAKQTSDSQPSPSQPSPSQPSPSDWTNASPEPAAPAQPAPPSAIGLLYKRLEASFVNNWLVWIGGATLAIGGIYLVGYLIERNVIGPVARLSLGILFGVGLVGAGEWVRRRTTEWHLEKDSFIPAAVSGAGIIAVFASLFVGYNNAGLLPVQLAFVLMAITTLVAIGLAPRFGPFLALLGLAGSHLTPIIVNTNSANAMGLFSYLLFITAFGLIISVRQQWQKLIWIAVGAALMWPWLWIVNEGIQRNPIVLLCYLAALIALVQWQVAGFEHCPVAERELKKGNQNSKLINLSWAIGWGYLLLHAGWMRNWELVYVAITVALFVTHYAIRHWVNEKLWLIAATTFWIAQTRALSHWEPQLTAPFWLLPALFGTLSFINIEKLQRPLWPVIAGTAAPILMLISAYNQGDTSDHLRWALSGLLALAFYGGVFSYFYRRLTTRENRNPLLATVIVGMAAALIFTFTMLLEQSWFAVGLLLLVPVLTWVARFVPNVWLTRLTLLLGFWGVAYLLLNGDLATLNTSVTPVLNWTLYSFGLSALALWYAARLAAEQGNQQTHVSLQALSLALVMALIGIDLRHAFSGSVTGEYSLLEAGAQVLTWGVLAVYRARHLLGASELQRALFGISSGLAAVNLIAALTVVNPLFSAQDVGRYLIANALLLAYLIPALIMAALVRFGQLPLSPRQQQLAGVGVLLLAMLYLSLEVRHYFHPDAMHIGRVTQPENYGYSLVWLCFGVALWIAGSWQRIHQLRMASLAVVLVTVLKAFLIDMSQLTGLFRIASFIGLGMMLLVLGYFYQRSRKWANDA